MLGSNEAVKEAVKAGLGISMLSARSVAEDVRQGTLVRFLWRMYLGSGLSIWCPGRTGHCHLLPSAFAHHLQAEAEQENMPHFNLIIRTFVAESAQLPRLRTTCERQLPPH